MLHSLKRQSYFVQRGHPKGLVEDLLVDTGINCFEEVSNFLDLKISDEKINMSSSIGWIHSYLKDQLKTKYFKAQVSFAPIQKNRSETGIHYDLTHAIFDSSDLNLIQVWIPLYENNLPESNLRIYPRFIGGNQMYTDDSYEEFILRKTPQNFIKTKNPNSEKREGAARYDLPVEIRNQNYVDFNVRRSIGSLIWYNSNCLHQSSDLENPINSEKQRRIALAPRFVREGCPLRANFKLADLHRKTNEGEYIRSAVEKRYFDS